MIRVGTRGSRLATAQTEWVIGRIRGECPELDFRVVTLTTSGDQDQSTPLPAMGGRGAFTSEVERALLFGEIDMAVHSLKDLPVEAAPGLIIAAIPAREEPADALITRSGADVLRLDTGAIVGTSSPRRQAQLAAVRPDLAFRQIRGNVETRVRKVAVGEYDATVLAVAGLRRSRLEANAVPISFDVMLPAPGQGALAVQCRDGDTALINALRRIDCANTRRAVTEERRLLALLRGGCHAPVGAGCGREGAVWTLRAAVAKRAGYPVQRARVCGPSAEGLAERVIEQLDLHSLA